MIFVDIDTIITMFKTTYFNSQLTGAEIARILEIRYGQNQKPQTHAPRSEDD